MPDHPADWRRALAVLADTPQGATKALLAAHGISSAIVSELVDSGLATSNTEVTLVDARPVQVTRLRITDAGRASLERRRR